MKCPKCRKEIEDLRFYAKVERWGTFFMGNTPEYPEYDTKEDGDWSDLIFCCPKCDAILFQNSDDAEDFLRVNKERKKALYCENCFKDNLKKRLELADGTIVCSINCAQEYIGDRRKEKEERKGEKDGRKRN